MMWADRKRRPSRPCASVPGQSNDSGRLRAATQRSRSPLADHEACPENSTGFPHLSFKTLWNCAARKVLAWGIARAMRRFLADRRGNYALMTAVAMVPLMGGMALAVDYAEMNRQKQAVANALDAAGIATARQVVSGATDSQLIAYANNFFKANLD